MCKIDAAVERSLEACGYSKVLVVLQEDRGSTSGQSNKPADIPDVFLEELPDAAGRDRAKRRARDEGLSVAAAQALELSESRPPMKVPERKLVLNELGIECGFLDENGLSQLASNDFVAAILNVSSVQVESIREVSSTAVPKPRTTLTWGLKRLHVNELWSEGLTGMGVGIAHLDTGVDSDHPSLAGRLVGFMETTLDGGPGVTQTQGRDTDWHGTHTAGIMCGSKLGKVDIGVAPEANLYSCVVIEGGNIELRLLSGINWALSLKDRVRVLNLSLGTRSMDAKKSEDEYSVWKRVIDRCREAGILPIVAIGNEGPGTSRSPGNFTNVLSVGASDPDDKVASFSSSVSIRREVKPYEPSVVAPGVGIVSSAPKGLARDASGTSMATAFISGIAALLFQARPDATPGAVHEAIQRSCRELTNAQSLRQGYGLVDPRIAHDILMTL